MECVERKSNLVVPEGFVELDREEMTYVDGGGEIVLMSYSANDSWKGAVGLASIAGCCAILGSSFGYIGSALLVGGETVCKIAGAIFEILGWLMKALAGDLAICALLATERASQGRGFSLVLNTFFGIPIGLGIK